MRSYVEPIHCFLSKLIRSLLVDAIREISTIQKKLVSDVAKSSAINVTLGGSPGVIFLPGIVNIEQFLPSRMTGRILVLLILIFHHSHSVGADRESNW